MTKKETLFMPIIGYLESRIQPINMESSSSNFRFVNITIIPSIGYSNVRSVPLINTQAFTKALQLTKCVV